MLTDEHEVAQLIEARERAEKAGIPSGPTGPPLAGWGQDVDILANIYDRLGELANAIIALGGGRPPERQRHERPTTAYDKANSVRRQQRHEELVALFLPPDQRT